MVLVINLHIVSTYGWTVSGSEPIYQIAVNNSNRLGRLLPGGWVPMLQPAHFIPLIPLPATAAGTTVI